MPNIDAPKAPRKGEELPVQQLAAYLSAHLSGIDAQEISVSQFPGGFSNLTYLVEWGQHSYVLRRPPSGANIKSAHDMAREYRTLTQLRAVYDKVPQTLLLCEDEAIIGAPFYLMERVKGVILRPQLSAEAAPRPEIMAGIATALTETLVELHQIDISSAGLASLGRPEGYAARQVEGWTKRYAHAKTDDIPGLEAAARWLSENIPAPQGASLLHNDYKYDNLVLAPDDLTRVLAVLDWEMATLGDPLMDLGTSLGYWVTASDPDVMLRMRLSPTHLPGNPTREELVQQYALKSGRDVGHVVFYYVYGLFKVATIGQQIYARYQKGLTQDERFGALIHAVRGCGVMAQQAISKRRLDDLF